MNCYKKICLFAVAASLLMSGCSVSKFIPEGQYLLDNVRIESDNKEIKPSQLDAYVRQKPNAKWFSLVKLPLYIYGASGLDSTKRINRFWRKIGDAPVIYDRAAAQDTRDEIRKAVQNSGYMGASVDLDEITDKKKIKVRYRVRSGEPYTVDSLSYGVTDYDIAGYLRADSAKTLLHEGMRFDVNVLDMERQRITQRLQNEGYFKFNKDYIVFQADTMLNTHRVGLTMNVLPYRQKKEDAPGPHRSFRVRNVNYVLGMDNFSLADNPLAQLDAQQYKGVNYYYDKRPFLRPKVLADCNFIRPGSVYSRQDVQNTYSSLGRLRILKYSDIRFNEVQENDSTWLDAYVSLSRNKKQSVSFEVEGTNSAGDLGAAASVEYTHHNLFRGSEAFSVKVRGAYEAITGLEGYSDNNYMEYGVESSLSFPGFMLPFLSSDFKRRVKATSEVNAKYNWQIRPEFERTSASAGWSYRWQGKGKSTHRFDLVDINYIYMPTVSSAFREYLSHMMEVNPLVVYSYTDLFIVRMGYTFTYNSRGQQKTSALHNSYSFRFSIEEAGNLLYGFSRLVNKHPKDGNAFKLASIDFAQYVKMDVDFAKNFVMDSRNSFVFHAGLGVGIPYGNSQSLPFEKLYFSGGANSVRGWHVRALGPGNYQGSGNSLDYVTRTGDIKLDLNLEYRTFLFWKLNGAVFIDAGNVWNLRHQGDDSGLFRFNRFYKQLAASYGLGIRFDLDFLILRFDGGMKAVNPMATGRDRYPVSHPNFKRDFAFHFAVGYPF